MACSNLLPRTEEVRDYTSADLRGPRLLGELGVAFGFEFVPRLPGRQGAGVGDAVTDGDEELRVVDRAAQVPVRTDFVRRGVIVLLVPLVLARLDPVGRL